MSALNQKVTDSHVVQEQIKGGLKIAQNQNTNGIKSYKELYIACYAKFTRV